MQQLTVSQLSAVQGGFLNNGGWLGYIGDMTDIAIFFTETLPEFGLNVLCPASVASLIIFVGSMRHA